MKNDSSNTNGLSIQAEILDSVSNAAYQNYIPILVDLKVCNSSNNFFEKLNLTLECRPNLVAKKHWRIDQLLPKSTLAVRDRDLSIEGALLASLTESMRATLTLTLSKGTEQLFIFRKDLCGLAKNEWGGLSQIPELIAAFIQPNDPAVPPILRKASEILETSGEDPSLDGYQSRSRQRVWQILNALWLAVVSKNIRYAEPPASFERQGQKVRSPSDIIDSGLATCLDSSLLFASAMEALGIYPILVFLEGHVLCGAWLQPLRLPTLSTDDCSDIRKFIDLQELLVFESTLVTRKELSTFGQAIEKGNTQIQSKVEHHFHLALDIQRAREQKIRPLTQETKQLIAQKARDESPLQLTLERPPDLPAFDFGLDDGTTPDTPETRLSHWKRKLLDLTKRNRLLNLKYSKTAIRLRCPNPALLEDKMAEGKKIKVVPLTKLSNQIGHRSEDLYQDRTGKDYTRELAFEALNRNEIVSELSENDLRTSLIQIFRKTNTDLQEGGANTLFLALGLLKWKASPHEKRTYLAPLILFPITLLRKNVAATFKLIQHEDEPVFNLTLLELLKSDFGVEIPELKGELPRDTSGIDVVGIWNLVRKKLRDLQGFEVLEHTVLSNFSFAKYLMWKDLADRTDLLKQSPFVKHLIDHPREGYTNSANFVSASDLDQTVNPRDLLMPLPADSSQILAIHASTQQGDFILEGPPGTGKSQTIANIIAHNLGMGRRVLFVSEKMAALDVVYRRLRDIGLGKFCLELHSSKANKKDVLDQLRWVFEEQPDSVLTYWEFETQKLKDLRDKLNHLVAELHRPHKSGISPFAAMARSARHGEHHRFRLQWNGPLENDPIKDDHDFERYCKLAQELGLCFKGIEKSILPTFKQMVVQTDWSKDWEKTFIAGLEKLELACEQLQTTAHVFSDQLGLPNHPLTYERIQGLAKIVKALPIAAVHPIAFGLEPESKTAIAAFEKALKGLEDYRHRKRRLSLSYEDESIFQALLPLWSSQWRQAEQSFWLFRVWKKHKIRQEIRLFFGLPKASDPILDLPQLLSLKELRQTLENQAKTFPRGIPWQGLNTPSEQGQAVIEACDWVAKGISQWATSSEELEAIRQCLKKNFTNAQDLLSNEATIGKSGARLNQALKEFENAWQTYQEEHGKPQEYPQSLSNFQYQLRQVLNHQHHLHAWCQWQEACQKSNQAALGALIAALESGAVTDTTLVEEFKTAYCVWVADHLLDNRDALRKFSGIKHNAAIEEFRLLDKKVATMSAQYIAAQIRSSIPRLNPKRLLSGSSGYSTLARELKKKTRHIPVRKLISEMGRTLTTLTPCLLMSPLSISQYLSPEETLFDLVIFDEASQITVWDAIGAIARGKNVIIVGDPKQMPPSNFFAKSQGSDQEDQEEAFDRDLESILDEAMASQVKTHRLKGHYRSKNESLITFSNHRYYDGGLVTFPSCQTRDSAVSLIKTNGIYQRGKTRTNPDEAKALVADVLKRLNSTQYQNLSMGIVTLNSEQQRLIEDLLEQERLKNSLLEPFFAKETLEPIFVKNLETVQGDQRDIIFLSIGYGPDTLNAKTMSMNFGPLNKSGGERRLNVAITRATTEMVIYCSFSPSLIDLARTRAEAVRDLKHYLEFAEKGPTALEEAVQNTPSLHQYDSDFEEAVANDLRQLGWTVHTQIGVSKFRIDLGIVHPDQPGRYLSGVECDGASYHSSPTARDRDRVRQNILENLGWNLIRIWSTDYFIDRKSTMKRISKQLEELYERDSKQSQERFQNSEPPTDTNLPENQTIPVNLSHAPSTTTSSDSGKIKNSSQISDQNQRDRLAKSKGTVEFFDPTHLPEIQTLLLHWIDTYGPITYPHLCGKVLTHFEFSKLTPEMKHFIKTALGKMRSITFHQTFAAVLWPLHLKPQLFFKYRGLIVQGEKRSWAQVPICEKFTFAREALEIHPHLPPSQAIATQLGLNNPASVEIATKLQPLVDAYQEVSSTPDRPA